jgi:hypothetical protein
MWKGVANIARVPVEALVAAQARDTMHNSTLVDAPDNAGVIGQIGTPILGEAEIDEGSEPGLCRRLSVAAVLLLAVEA